MVASQTSRGSGPYTVADYDLLPDDGPRYELVDGELIEMPSPGSVHQQLVVRLAALILALIDPRRLGVVYVSPFDVQLGDMVVQPDVCFFAEDRRHGVVGGRRAHAAPDLAVEVSSEATRRYDLNGRRELYRRHGVREYWFIDVEARRATVSVLVGDRYVEQRPDAPGTHASTVLPDLVVDVEELIRLAER